MVGSDLREGFQNNIKYLIIEFIRIPREEFMEGLRPGEEETRVQDIEQARAEAIAGNSDETVASNIARAGLAEAAQYYRERAGEKENRRGGEYQRNQEFAREAAEPLLDRLLNRGEEIVLPTDWNQEQTEMVVAIMDDRLGIDPKFGTLDANGIICTASGTVDRIYKADNLGFVSYLRNGDFYNQLRASAVAQPSAEPNAGEASGVVEGINKQGATEVKTPQSQETADQAIENAGGSNKETMASFEIAQPYINDIIDGKDVVLPADLTPEKQRPIEEMIDVALGIDRRLGSMTTDNGIDCTLGNIRGIYKADNHGVISYLHYRAFYDQLRSTANN